jgi:hypothetical protein
MATVTVFFDVKEDPSKEIVSEDHRWYDTIKQEMLYFKGGKLSFKYIEDDYLIKMGSEERYSRGIKSTYRMLPVVEEVVANNYFNMIKTTNKNTIINWFHSSGYGDNTSISYINDIEVSFDILDIDQELFCDGLERERFRYVQN